MPTDINAASSITYNWTGGLVFEAHNFAPNDLAFGWDGTFNGQVLNSGVFVYVVEVVFVNDTNQLYKGDLTLIR